MIVSYVLELLPEPYNLYIMTDHQYWRVQAIIRHWCPTGISIHHKVIILNLVTALDDNMVVHNQCGLDM